MTDFSGFGLNKKVLSAINSLGYKESLDIQAKIIPLVLKGKNVVFQSETGSGKTLAFTAGFLSRLNKKQGLHSFPLSGNNIRKQAVSVC